MKKIVLFLNILLYTVCYAQESFSIKYYCMRPFKDGVWGHSRKTLVQFDFSVGENKDIMLKYKDGNSRFTRIGDPMFRTDDDGVEYQVIRASNGGINYFIQYMENYNIRVIRQSDAFTHEYSCAEVLSLNFNSESNLYTVVSQRAYFHNEPNIKSRRNAYLIYGEIVKPMQEKNGFVYVSFTNPKGIKSKGWILKSNLSFP